MDHKALILVVCGMGLYGTAAQGQLQAPMVASIVGPEGSGRGAKPQAPNAEVPMPVWASAGMGGGHLGVAYDASLNLMRGRYIYTVDAWGSSGKALFNMFGNPPWKNFSSYNVTFSRVISGDAEDAIVSVGLGISLSSMTYRTEVPGTGGFLSLPDLKATTVRTVGLPLMIRFSIPTRSAVGVDMTMRADVNGERSAVGAMIGMRLGRIHPAAGVEIGQGTAPPRAVQWASRSGT